MDNGFSIAMTPVQLAAVMEDETATGDSVSNRIWGGVGFLGSVLELASATALCLVPEPTGLTKAGCIVVGAHSLDGISSSAYQLYSGRQTASMTASATAGIAKELGATDDTAEQVGIAVDMIIPFTVAGAARVASVKMGQFNLMKHEAVKGVVGGGHAMKKHVGKSSGDLIEKVVRGKQSGTFKASHAASSFTSVEVAEKAISKALKQYRWEIRSWAKSTPADRERLYFRFRSTYKSQVGIVVKYDATTVHSTNKFEVVLKKEAYNNKPYYVVTAFPILD